MPERPTPPDSLTVGERVAWWRRDRGMTQVGLASAVYRSREWVRLLETEGRGADRLDNLVLLARALRLPDLSSLTGHLFSASVLTLPEHPAVPAVRRVLGRISLVREDSQRTPSLAALRDQLDQAWTAWNTKLHQHTALGHLVPDLLLAAVSATRAAPPEQRSAAHALLVEAYLAAQRFAYGVRAVDLATQCTERALLAAEAADDPRLLAMAGWGSALTALTAGRHEEAEEIAVAAAQHVRLPQTDEQAAQRGALLLFAAMGAAGTRSGSTAWGYWTEAEQIARRLGPRHHHQQTMFGLANVGIYGVAIEVDFGRTSAALTRAQRVDPTAIASTNRRAQHHLDVARIHEMVNDPGAMRESLLASFKASHETVGRSPDGLRMVTHLRRSARRKDPELKRLGSHLGLT